MRAEMLQSARTVITSDNGAWFLHVNGNADHEIICLWLHASTLIWKFAAVECKTVVAKPEWLWPFNLWFLQHFYASLLKRCRRHYKPHSNQCNLAFLFSDNVLDGFSNVSQPIIWSHNNLASSTWESNWSDRCQALNISCDVTLIASDLIEFSLCTRAPAAQLIKTHTRNTNHFACKL